MGYGTCLLKFLLNKVDTTCMARWQQFLLGTLGLIGMTFAHDIVVKVIYSKPAEEEIIYVDEPPKKRIFRRTASSSARPLLAQPYAAPRIHHDSSSSSSSNHSGGGGYGTPEAPVDSLPSSMDTSVGFTNQDDPYYPSRSPSSSPSTSSSSSSRSGNKSDAASNAAKGGGSAFAFSMPGTAAQKKAATTTSTTTSDGSVSSSGSSSTPAVPVPFTETYTFTDDDAPNYVIDSAKVQISGDVMSLIVSDQSLIDSLQAEFAGHLLGLEYDTNSLVIGTGESCNSLTANCAEFDSSWIPQASDVMAFYHFNETTNGLAPGAKDFADSSGNNRHGTKVNNPRFNVQGRMQGALRNGSSSVGGAALPVDMSSTNKMTVSFWFNNQSPLIGGGDANVIIEYTTNFNFNEGFYFAANDCSNGLFPCNNITFAGHSGAAYNVKHAPPMSLGWQHIVLVYDRSVIPNIQKVYKNGEPLTITQVAGLSGSAINNFNNEGFYLFGRQGSAAPAEGDIDELAVWKSVLTDDDVKTIYERQSAAFGRGSSLGIYTSEVKDAQIATLWQSFEWTTPFPFGKEIVNDNNSYSQAEGSLRTGLLAHWKMNETAGSLTMAEAVSNLTATPASGLTLNEEGKINSGAYFDGTTNAYATVNSPSTLNIRTSDWSVGAWIKTPKTGMQFIISKSLYGPGVGRWAMGLGLGGPGALVFMYDIGGGGVEINCAANLADNKWHYVLTTLDRDGDMKLYADGVQCATHSIASSSWMDWNTGHNVYIGTYNDNTGLSPITVPNGSFQGSIDELSVWNRVITDGSGSSHEEVQNLYRRGISRVRHQLRFCDDDQCDGETWIGPDGTTDSFFSELNNAAAGTPVMTFGSPQTTRYIQYRSVLETDSALAVNHPELKTVSLPKTGYETEGSGIVTDGTAYKTFTSFTETLGAGGCTSGVRYQISTSPIGPWYYWNNTIWTLGLDYTDTNTVDELNDPIAINQLHSQFGQGTMYFNVLLMSSGASVCELESFEIQGER